MTADASTYSFRRAHGRRAIWELARYLRVLPPSTMRELIDDVACVLESGMPASELKGGNS